MAGIDLGKGLQSLIKGAADTVQGAVDTVKNATKDIKLPEIKPEQITSVFARKPAEAAQEPAGPAVISRVSIGSALKIIYYMMAVDGEIFHGEEEKFDSIGRELDPDYAAHKEQIIGECQAQMGKSFDEEDRYDALQDGVTDAIRAAVGPGDASIAPKLLVWDLLAIAYSDGAYNGAEQKLLKYIVRRLDIDRAVFLELESSLLTLVDLERELNWIKTTDRPYLTIQAAVDELENRKRVVFDSVTDLIGL
ncbi:MAG: hypothetical protein IJH78_04110 [Clostridia bacterium]|nr:hypothetical protein [Clostridia bacterium]